MKIKEFNNIKITIEKLSKKDLNQPNKFQAFINSLVKENVQIKENKKKTLKEETEWLKENLNKIKKHKTVFLVAKYNNKIIGSTSINLHRGKEEHVAEFGISILKDYRGIGLGEYLTTEIIKLSKTQLQPKPKIIRLSVFPTNKAAISLYEKMGFKKVAQIPKQLFHKGKFFNEIIMLLHLKS